MLATHVHPLSLHSPSTPTTGHCSPLRSRSALVDSTNVNSRSNVCDPGCPKRLVFQTSSTRAGCVLDNVSSSVGSIPTSFHPYRNHASSTPSPFPVTYKARPTVSVSFSEACSQNVSGERSRSSKVHCLEPDLPDVRSAVPFPSTPLDGNSDVDMLDGTRASSPDSHALSASQGPRKRRSAHSVVSPTQRIPGKVAKQKRPRKSRQQVVELWWLGVVHRSILRCIEARQSFGEPGSSDRLPQDLDAMDRALVERIQERLAENGCVEGRALPEPLQRVLSPSTSTSSLNLSMPSRKSNLVPDTSLSELDSKETTLHGTTTSPLASRALPCTSLSIIPRFPIPPSTFTSLRHRVRFEVPQQSRELRPLPSILRRSPSPPPRTGAVSPNAQTLTLTMPQLVASLILAHHERSGLRSMRGRSNRDCRKNAGHSLSSVPRQVAQYNGDDAIQDKDRMLQSFSPRMKLSSAPKRKSPLSCVTHTESCALVSMPSPWV